MEHLKAEYEKWRETGHDITYEQWLEIVLDVERNNHAWMIEQYKILLQQKEADSNVLRLHKDSLIKALRPFANLEWVEEYTQPTPNVRTFVSRRAIEWARTLLKQYE